MKAKLAFLLVPFAFALSACSDSDKPNDASAAGPMPVPVASPEMRQVKLTKTYTGRFAAVERVDLRSRVSGYIDKIHFQEGQEIKQGDPMFSIDPRLFDTALTNAEAKLTQINAAIRLAEGNLTRAKSLVEKNAISREELEIRQAELDQAKADLAAAEAGVETARLKREFADITAPISGIAGRFRVTPGNFITGGNAAAEVLTTIVPHHPIDCFFEVDERQVLEFTRLYFQNKTSGRDGDKRPTVKIAVSDSDKFEFEGTVDFAENELDTSTATMRLRARVANENKFLTPGLFARVQIPIGTESELMLVDDASLGFDQDKRFAWVLQDDNTVQKTFVKVGPLQGSKRVILSGLDADDKIAVGRIQFLRPGTPIQPIDPSAPAAPQG